MKRDQKLKWLVIGVIVLSLLGCSQQQDGDRINLDSQISANRFNLDSRNFRIGLAPFPRNFPGANQEDYLAMDRDLPEAAEILTGQDGNWRGLIRNGLDSSLVGFAGEAHKRHKGMIGMFGINYVDATEVHQNGTLQIDWTSEEDKNAYKNLAVKICKKYHAEYLALGIENNFHYRYRPQDYDLWVETYQWIYDEIKKECPTTNVFVTFQYEMTNGLGSKYFGEHDPEWEIIDKFGDKLDLIAFTSYPELEYDTIDQIPDDYYSRITEHVDKPIAFTELGWQDGNGLFIEKFVTLTKGLDLDFVLWIFMHDVDLKEGNPFPGVGLREHDGTPKGAWFAWKELKEVPYLND